MHLKLFRNPARAKKSTRSFGLSALIWVTRRRWETKMASLVYNRQDGQAFPAYSRRPLASCRRHRAYRSRDGFPRCGIDGTFVGSLLKVLWGISVGQQKLHYDRPEGYSEDISLGPSKDEETLLVPWVPDVSRRCEDLSGNAIPCLST